MSFSSSRLRAVPVALAAVMLIASAPGAHAQVNFGAVRGTVKDPQGASIRGAEVTLTNVDTKVAHTITSNDVGAFLFGGVDPGTYTVKVAITGFKTYEQTGIIVTLGNTQTADAMLPIADAAGETVEVTAESVTLNTANATAAQVFSEQQIQDLPSLGRNPFMFATLAANVVTLGDPRYVRAEDSTGSSQVSLSGAPSGTNSYEVDGIPVSTSSGGETFVVSPDAVSSAKVSTDTFDAQIGRSGGGVFATSFKSGSAQYHGTLYGETRQTPWSANTYGNTAATPSDETYLYSGAFGGPIPFAKKNRWLKDTFFWVTEEGYRQGQPNTGTNNYYVPTAAERTGDFSAYAPANGSKTSCTGTTGAAGGQCFIVYDPTSYAAGARTSYLTENGANKVPTAAINPIGSFVANAFQAPSNTNLYGAASGTGALNACGTYTNWCLPSQAIKTRSDEYIGKVEHTFAPWWTSSASYLHDAVQEPDIDFHLDPAPIGTQYAGGSTKLIRYFDATSLYNTFTVTPTTLLTIGYGFNRYYSASVPYSTGFNAATGFGGTGFPTGLTSNMASQTFPTFTLTNTSNAAPLGGSFSGPGIQASHNFVATVSKTVGKHDIRVGYVWRGFSYFTNPQTGSAGSYSFTGQNTNGGTAVGTSVSANGPLAIADLLVGQPASATMQINQGPFFNRETYNSVFVQDDYRLSSKLTVNLGLRYELEGGQYEASNKYNVGFDPTATASYAGASGTVTTKGGLDFAGVNKAPVHCCSNGKDHFSPRIGLAYQLNSKTVMHTGYGIFFAPVGINTAATQGYSQSTSYAPGNTTAALAVGSAAYLSSPFGGGTALLQPSANTLGSLTGIGATLGTVALFNRKYPSVQQYMLDVQRQLPYDIILTVSYIGAHGVHFINTENINQAPDSVLSTYAANGTAANNLSTKVANPLYTTNKFNGIYPATGVLSNATFAQGQFTLPYPQFTSITAQVANGNSAYNSLAVKGEKRLSKGLSVLATYTYSANWDSIWTTGSQVYQTYGPQDIYNTKREVARSINSVPNRVTMAITDQLPFGKGHMFLGNPQGFVGHAVDTLIGGWELNYEQIIQNGVPMSIIQTNLTTTEGTTGIGGSYQRPNIITGDPHSVCFSGKPQGRLGALSSPNSPYMNQAAITPALPYTYGNAPRSLPCRAPGSDTATASINKTFSLGERLKLQARFEALNLWNTPQFAPVASTNILVSSPTTTVGGTAVNPITTAPTVSAAGSQTFGKNLTQIGFGRVIQMGGRLTF